MWNRNCITKSLTSKTISNLQIWQNIILNIGDSVPGSFTKGWEFEDLFDIFLHLKHWSGDGVLDPLTKGWGFETSSDIYF